MSQNTRMRTIRREKKLGLSGYGTHWKTSLQKYSVSKEWRGELQYHQTSKISSSLVQYSIFIGLFIVLNLFSVHDSGATVYTCLDRLGQTIFTDSPAQLHNCKVLSFLSPTSNTEKEVAEETFSPQVARTENFEPASAQIPPQLGLNRIAESESMPAVPPALHDNQAPPSTPFSNLELGEIPSGLIDLLESGNMPSPKINEGNVPQGLPFTNGVPPFAESQKDLPETGIQQLELFIPPDDEAPTLSEVPDSIFSSQWVGPGIER